MQEENQKTYYAHITWLDNDFERVKYDNYHIDDYMFYFYLNNVVTVVNTKSTKKITYTLPE